jgi:energy-coupling factor transporter ATP-binding protein EcfA2
MKLTFVRPHLSIGALTETNISDFTVLTGVNGSGKSHLLEALEVKSVLIDGRSDLNIVRFNFETFKLENEGAYNAMQLSAEREAAWNLLLQVRANVVQYKSALGPSYTELTQSLSSSGKSLWGVESGEVATYKRNLRTYFGSPQIKGNQASVGLFALAQKLPYSLDEISRSEFENLYQPFETKADFLPHALGKIIWDYYVKLRNNQVNEFQNEKHGKNYPVKTEREFTAAHGEKPWEVLNTVLKQFDSLDYRVDSPEGSDVFGNYTFQLVHTRLPKLEIPFSSLSSGERVLMALVASIYKVSADKFFPDVILLDELDASLHPSMIKNMLAVISNIFLERGIKVVLVTHSPTTIALAPEEAVYVMNKQSERRIEKSTKRIALSILTEGFATLEEGLTIFDEVARNKLSIVTEGHNVKYIERAMHLAGISGASLVEGLEDVAGKSQLKILFDFSHRVNHEKKVLFVWDCDAHYQLTEANNSHYFFLPKNAGNALASRGIENMFEEGLFNDYKKTITNSLGITKIEFDETRKRDFEKFVLQRKCAEDFRNFESLCSHIRALSA